MFVIDLLTSLRFKRGAFNFSSQGVEAPPFVVIAIISTAEYEQEQQMVSLLAEFISTRPIGTGRGHSKF